ncbi:MAG: metallophosphoesterase [Pseudomonadota bacterium]
MFKPKGPRHIANPAGPKGKRAYAIGDIHGRYDLLEALLWAIRKDASERPTLDTHLVSLGDLIDRGPESNRVVEAFTGPQEGFMSTNVLMGNHEEMLLRGLTGEANLLQGWLDHGGYACAESYGVNAAYLRGQTADTQFDALSAAIPDSHVSVMRKALECIRFGDFLFTHAGIRPGVAPDQQTARDMRWIRKEFLESDAPLGCVVVHGHTVTDHVVERSNRVGLDTGAYKTGLLTAMMIEGPERVFIKAFDDGNRIRVSRELRPGLPD